MVRPSGAEHLALGMPMLTAAHTRPSASKIGAARNTAPTIVSSLIDRDAGAAHARPLGLELLLRRDRPLGQTNEAEALEQRGALRWRKEGGDGLAGGGGVEVHLGAERAYQSQVLGGFLDIDEDAAAAAQDGEIGRLVEQRTEARAGAL